MQFMTARLDLLAGTLTGDTISASRRTLAGLRGYFEDEAARAAMDQDLEVYRVEAFEPVPERIEGAVCAATTFLAPGKVGDEYFLTRGHFHADQDRPELCLCVSGRGALILMTKDRAIRVETLSPGILVHVPPRTAHRCANTGDVPLVFVSFWASETGHDYETIAREGFSARLRELDGRPTLVPV